MDDLKAILSVLTSLTGLAAGLVRLARELREWADRRKKKGRRHDGDDLTS